MSAIHFSGGSQNFCSAEVTLSYFPLYSVLIIFKTYFSVIFKGFGAEGRFDDDAVSAFLTFSLLLSINKEWILLLHVENERCFICVNHS